MGTTIEACMQKEDCDALKHCLAPKPIYEGLLYHKSQMRNRQLLEFLEAQGHKRGEDSHYSGYSSTDQSMASIQAQSQHYLNSSIEKLRADLMIND